MAKKNRKNNRLGDTEIMAAKRGSGSGNTKLDPIPKKTRQGSGQHTKYAASSRNGARKRYRGQGRG